MKRVFIIHAWGFNPKMNWYLWLKSELEKRYFEVFIPEMPNTDEPKIEEWISHLKKVVGKIDYDTYFVGHSIWCQTIMRYLERENVKVGNVVFVAGWFKLDNLENDSLTYHKLSPLKEACEPSPDCDNGQRTVYKPSGAVYTDKLP